MGWFRLEKLSGGCWVARDGANIPFDISFVVLVLSRVVVFTRDCR